MEELHSVFREKLYYAGFVRRREYADPSGRRLTGRACRDWTRCYVEVRGPLVYFWKAGSCDFDPASISRLKREQATPEDSEYPAIDTRLVEVEELEDFCVDRSTLNALSINHAHGLDRIHIVAPNSTSVKTLTSAILHSAKEAQLLDQRYTMGLLVASGAPSFTESLLPDPATLSMRWPGSVGWLPVVLSVEAKKGYAGSHYRERRTCRCIYLYSDDRARRCLGRLTSIAAIHALRLEPPHPVEEPPFYFCIQADGKRKSSKIGGLSRCSGAWFQAGSRELLVKWVTLLRNCFELLNHPALLATVAPIPVINPDQLTSLSPASGNSNSRSKSNSSLSNSSDHSMNSAPPAATVSLEASLIDGSVLGPPIQRPWEAKKAPQIDHLARFASLDSHRPRHGSSFTCHPGSARNEAYIAATMMAARRQSGQDWQQYETIHPSTPQRSHASTIYPSTPTLLHHYHHPRQYPLPPPLPFFPPHLGHPLPSHQYQYQYQLSSQPQPQHQPQYHQQYHYQSQHPEGGVSLLPALAHSTSRHSLHSLPAGQTLHRSSAAPFSVSVPASVPRSSMSTSSRAGSERPSESSRSSRGSAGKPAHAPVQCLAGPDYRLRVFPAGSIAGSTTMDAPRRSFASMFENTVQTKPYSSVPCTHLFALYEQYCQTNNIASGTPIDVRRWMFEMGYTLKASECEEQSWHHIAIKP